MPFIPPFWSQFTNIITGLLFGGQVKSILGKYVLDSLSFGMYDHPFMVIREYIQNSVDAIDDYIAYCQSCIDYKGQIDINIDGNEKSIKIVDNGSGIPITKSWHSLHDLGRSTKYNRRHRGFRGIGRLGGLGYCDELVFITKAEGEDVVSKNVWDCIKIRSLVSNKADISNASSIIEQAVTFYEEKYTGDTYDHFFAVEMNGIRSKRGLLLNVPAIKNYISQAAPVPFNTESFNFANIIDKALRENVPSYDTYKIRVNGDYIFKPYSNTLGIQDHGLNNIDNVILFKLADDHSILAFGWIGEHSFLGTIWPSNLTDGLRLRAGNILIGDIGIPYSKKIRALSAKRSAERRLEDAVSLCSRAKGTIKWGYIAEKQKYDIIDRLEKLNGENPDGWSDKDIEDLINKLRNSNHILGEQNSSLISTDILKRLIEELYINFENKAKIESIVTSILYKYE